MEHQTEGLDGGECDIAQSGDTIYKDCNTTCSGDGCNDNNDVELLFSDLDENGDIKKIVYSDTSLFNYQYFPELFIVDPDFCSLEILSGN